MHASTHHNATRPQALDASTSGHEVIPALQIKCWLNVNSADCWVCSAALLVELETLVEQLDEQEASKQQALARAELAEQEVEALKMQLSKDPLVSHSSCRQYILLWPMQQKYFLETNKLC